MIAEGTIKELLKSRVMATKKIKVDDKTIADTISEILSYIDAINSTPEFTTTYFNGRTMDQIIIANEWKDFFTPESVRLDPTDLKTKDLLEREIKESKLISTTEDYAKFLDAQLRFRSFYKSDLSSNTTNLSLIRQPKALRDILPIATVGAIKEDDKAEATGSVHSIDDAFIPVRLKKEVGILYRQDYWNATVKQIVTDYCVKFML